VDRFNLQRPPSSPVLQASRRVHYLPEPILHYVSRRLDIPLAHILRATFYTLSAKPRGKYVISVVQGTPASCVARTKLMDSSGGAGDRGAT